MLRSCGVCCFGFSLFAIVFLLCVSAVLDSDSEIIEIPEQQRKQAANNCRTGAMIYGGFIGVSFLCYVIGRWQDGRREKWEGERQRLKQSEGGYHQV